LDAYLLIWPLLAGFAGSLLPAAAGSDWAFVREGMVYLHAAGSSVPRPLFRAVDPALSPNGDRIAYTEPRRFNRDDPKNAALGIYTLAAGQSEIILRPGAILSQPCWDPQGARLAFVMQEEGGRGQLQVIGAGGRDRRRIIAEGEQDVRGLFGLTWSPDGGALLFHDLEHWFRVTLDGRVASTPLETITGRPHSVTSRDRFVPNPRQPDLIAFTQSVPGTALFDSLFHEPNTALFTYDLKTKARRRLTAPPQLALDPAWSRDGDSIYFCGYLDREGRQPSPFRIYRVKRDGSGLAELLPGEHPSP
jgi:dipeptidyl aminopeptidase/acylaminoacyl peptidase